ncbi:MAG TPA: malto-oligosyltrehalose synthase [Nitrospiraceae bacterium]|nr:malto-oligosyltrehalose synthase [Nitrospiraceae bacterium]
MNPPVSHPRIPTATYRLQFNRTFTFVDAMRIVPYLHALGITDCYSSSYLTAVPGSPHGYDIVDPTTLNPDLGPERDYWNFTDSLVRHGMGQILDVVPNHMGISQSCNAWWLDVLENGPGSRYATFFDIDWHPVKAELQGKVLLPILGEQYGTVVEKQEIRLEYDEGRFVIRYGDHQLPIDPKHSVLILILRLDELIGRVGMGDPYVQEYQSILTAFRHLPTRNDLDPARVEERYREKEIIRRRLARIMNESQAIQAFVGENVTIFNGTKGDAKSFDLLDQLLSQQVYRLAHWRVASDEINYRRFFDVNDLAAIRMEDPTVFHSSHQLIFQLLKERAVIGLRIDHVDGLYDPSTYLWQLQTWAKHELFPDAGEDARPLFLVVEKILTRDEPLPTQWPVCGTTGYDFLTLVNGLFVDSSHEQSFTTFYARFIGTRVSFDDLAYEAKQLIMQASMSSEINMLGYQLNHLSEMNRRFRDFTLNSLIHAIREIIACFPVYRTYVTADEIPVMDRDRSYIRLAVTRAKRRNPALSGLVFDFVQELLLKEVSYHNSGERRDQLQFVMKFQQITGAVMAKGTEDTAFYNYNRFVSLNEVGGDPLQFGLSVPIFHERMHQRRALWPANICATSTHDTKRGEDVRARINVLSEMPQVWKAHVLRWSQLNKRFKTETDGTLAPDRNEEYLLYQTLIGAWPFRTPNEEEYRSFCERIQTYMAKAMKEAKAHTSWVNPNRAYDQAMHNFIEHILDRSGPNLFLADFLPFQEEIGRFGVYNSLAQVLLKISAPGIPDFYQGSELWDLNLVDPDNRRPVDYGLRAGLLADLQSLGCAQGSDRRRLVQELLAMAADGRIKLYVTMVGLDYRRSRACLFLHGEYVPLQAGGAMKTHVCAFARIHEDRAVVVVIPVLVKGVCQDAEHAPLGSGVWKDTWVTVPSWRPASGYQNMFTGETLFSTEVEGKQSLRVADVFSSCPVALLERMS